MKLIKKHKTKLQIAFAFLLFAVPLSASLWLDSKMEPQAEVKSESDSVDISAGVYSCNLTLKVKPENRIPITNNWQTALNVQVYNAANVYMGIFTGNTNNLGDLTLDICNQSVNLIGGDYSFYVKGKSHLNKKYNVTNVFNNYNENLDLTTTNELLIAGETSVVYDNYINVLDISTQISKYYTNDDTNDLNQDGEVNTLDFSNTINNIYMSGDCSPKNVIDGVCN